jgi:hypothetical protein
MNINDTLRALNDLEARIPRADKNERRRLANRVNELECQLLDAGHQPDICPGCGAWDIESHIEDGGLDSERFTCRPVRHASGVYFREDMEDVEMFDEATGPMVPMYIEDALDARPSLAAMSRIADQRIDAKALDRLARDVGVGS